MPKHNYICKKCGNKFEIERSYKDKSPVTCTICKSKQIKKIIGVPSISFKGDGFTLSKSE